MKNYHIIILDHVFRGRMTGKSNDIARLIYGAKFFNSETCFNRLVKICCNDIDARDFDAIVPVNTRDSHFSLPQRMCREIAVKLKLKYLDVLYEKNKYAENDVKNLKVLVFDDVIYTGATMRKSVNSCIKAGAKSVKFFAICHSKKFNPA